MLFGNYFIVSNKQLIVGTQDRFEASVARSFVHSQGVYHFLKRKGSDLKLVFVQQLLVIKVVER